MQLLRRLTNAITTQRLSSAARSVRQERLTYLSPAKLLRLEQAMERVKNIPGAFIEFGVALGGGSIVIAKAAKATGHAFAGYDVFATIPPPTSDKDDEKSKERYAVIAAGKSKGLGGDEYYGYRTDLYGDVTRALGRYGLPVDGTSIRLVKGLFEETWPDNAPQQIAFAHLDCDWYDPVKYCLDRVAERLSPGGMIVLDDYNAWSGCRAATDEFMSARSDFRFDPGPNPILVKLRA